MEKASTKDFKHIVGATFPNYRKRSVYVGQSDTVTLHDLNWSGGTRSIYRACTIDGKPLETAVNMSAPAPWNNPYEGQTINIPPGMVVVQGGDFCGKPSTLFIYFSPGDTPKQLTA